MQFGLAIGLVWRRVRARGGIVLFYVPMVEVREAFCVEMEVGCGL